MATTNCEDWRNVSKKINTPPSPTSEEFNTASDLPCQNFHPRHIKFHSSPNHIIKLCSKPRKIFLFFLRHFTLLHKKHYLHYSLQYVISILYLYLKKQFLSFQYESTWLATAALNRSRSSIIIISLGSRFQSTIVRGKKLNL